MVRYFVVASIKIDTEVYLPKGLACRAVRLSGCQAVNLVVVCTWNCGSTPLCPFCLPPPPGLTTWEATEEGGSRHPSIHCYLYIISTSLSTLDTVTRPSDVVIHLVIQFVSSLTWILELPS